MEVHCPSCKAVWNRDFIDMNFTAVFRTGSFAKHREKVLLDVEKARLPDTQDDAARYKHAVDTLIPFELKYKDLQTALYKSNEWSLFHQVKDALLRLNDWKMSQRQIYASKLYTEPSINHSVHTTSVANCVRCTNTLQTIKNTYDELHRKLTILKKWFQSQYDICPLSIEYNKLVVTHYSPEMQILRNARYTHGYPETTAPAKVKREFIKACPVTDCRGFLSTQWKCGICNVKVCKECHDPLSAEEVESDSHICNADKVASVKLIAAETRPCPKCSSVISKVSGCDQMFCTECKTPFSWKTGEVETGHIHNPHYFEWMRKSGTAIPQAPVGVLVCDMDHDTVIDQLRTRSYHNHRRLVLPTEDQQLCEIIYTRYAHMQHSQHVMRSLRRQLTNADEEKRVLRVRYLTNELTEKGWKEALRQIEKNHHLIRSRMHLLEMYLASFRDILNTFLTSTPMDVIKQLNQLLLFTMEQYDLINTRCHSTALIKSFINPWTDTYWTPPPPKVKKPRKKTETTAEDAEDAEPAEATPTTLTVE